MDVPKCVFGSKLDYPGYGRETWEVHAKAIQIQQVSMLNDARTATDQQQVEKQYGVRHSELYIVEHHVVDHMHNLLLDTSKCLMTMWKDSGILTIAQLEYLQQKIDGMKVPAVLDVFLINSLQTYS